MSQQDYVHACQRAELLGLPTPSEEEWTRTRKEEAQDDGRQENEDKTIENLDQSDESARRVGGGLDELNSILSATQKKINRFKTVCGSLGTLLKVRVASRSNTPEHKPSKPNGEVAETKETPNPEENMTIETSDNPENSEITPETNPGSIPQKKVDINEKMGSHLDKLDSLISKAENAQYSMQHQSKQMKKFLK
ncbi:uncharacterized protein LOC105697185 [Orussus abietinus]|uniref:uncharacterized protein LOC105697185 n=1 Tax=Orussus abietinus TaxID=222816 RepID=UPI0006264286|nr:uncharacterized protein LOC105697185 [Orussus abietinus]